MGHFLAKKGPKLAKIELRTLIIKTNLKYKNFQSNVFVSLPEDYAYQILGL